MRDVREEIEIQISKISSITYISPLVLTVLLAGNKKNKKDTIHSVQAVAQRQYSVYIPSCHHLMSIESPFDTIQPLLSSLVDVNILGGCAVSLTISGRRQKPEISEIMATDQVHARRSLSE